MRLRYCFGTPHFVTLAEAGRQAKRTAEWVRQLETVWKHYCATVILDQQDDEFIKAITKLLPMRDVEISRELIRQGWLKDTWGLHGIYAVYGFGGSTPGWQPLASSQDGMWVAESPEKPLLGRRGVYSVVLKELCGEEIVELDRAISAIRQANLPINPRLTTKRQPVSPETARALLEDNPDLIISGGHIICTHKSNSRSRFHNSSQVTLAACGALTAQTLWKGLERRFAARGATPVGLEMALEVWENHPDYVVDHNLVSLSRSAKPCPSSLAEDLAVTLVQLQGFVSRSEFLDTLTKCGFSVATAVATLSFSSILEPVPGARGWWRLRGSDATPSVVNIRNRHGDEVRVGTSELPDGTVLASFQMDPSTIGVVYLPAANSHNLRGKRFRVLLDTSEAGLIKLEGQRIAVNASGTSWGYRPVRSVAHEMSALPEVVTCNAYFHPTKPTVRVSFQDVPTTDQRLAANTESMALTDCSPMAGV
jgi:hypothetical protein